MTLFLFFWLESVRINKTVHHRLLKLCKSISRGQKTMVISVHCCLSYSSIVCNFLVKNFLRV